MSDRTPRAEDELRKGARTRSADTRRTRSGGGVGADLGSDAVWNAIRSPLRLQLLEAVATKPGATARDLADALGTSAPRLHYHLNILANAGLLRSVSGGVNGAGYEVAQMPSLQSNGEGSGEGRIRTLLVELVTSGMSSIGRSSDSDPQDGQASFARAGHEALAPHEIESVQAHLREIEAIFGRARERRTRARSLVGASVFLSICLASVQAPTLPDGLVGWGQLDAEPEREPVGRRKRSR